MKKIDIVTGEEFECAGDATCWCMKRSNVVLFKERECIGPARLDSLIEELESDTEGKSRSRDN